MDDIFYHTKHLAMQNKVALLSEAHKICVRWRVNISDSSTDYRRVALELSFEEILGKLNSNCHFVFIHRKSIAVLSDMIEIGFCTFTNPEYFLWLYIHESNLDYFIKEYELTKM